MKVFISVLFTLLSGHAIGASAPDVFRRTTILIEKPTVFGENLFIRGGLDFSRREGCRKYNVHHNCSIPLQYYPKGSGSHFEAVNAWSRADNYLDWGGAESFQYSYKDIKAEGTPTFWSTSDPEDPGYFAYNKYGPHYWVADLKMNCSRTENGFFEFKGFLNGEWENDIAGNGTCTGAAAEIPPFNSINHIGRCGYVNVYHYNEAECEILPY